MKTPLIEMENITVKYDDFPVLDNLYFNANAGEIRGLIGGNAAGKSTLGHVLAGVAPSYSGNIALDGKHIKIASRAQSEALGIRMSFHQVELFPDLSIFENIVAGRESSISSNRFFVPGKSKILKTVTELMRDLCLDLDPMARAHKLSEGEKLLIQLARTLIGNPKIIILDEATAILTQYETSAVFKVLHRLRDEGKCIIVVSHNLNEMLEHCDHISILKDGKIEATYSADEARCLPLVNILTGETTKFQYPRLPTSVGEPVMRVEHMYAGILKDISFTLHRGEILGVAGLVGSGRTTLANAVSGTIKLSSGNITFLQQHKRQSGNFGIVPDNFDVAALFSKLSIARNITVSNLRRVLKDLLISNGRESLYARDMVERLGISPSNIDERLHTLSAGNRQKVVIARSVFSNSEIYLFDEPTQNLSAVSKLEIYNIFNALISKGAAIILISSDFSELLGMSNRIIMLRDGQQVGEADNHDLDAESLYANTTG